MNNKLRNLIEQLHPALEELRKGAPYENRRELPLKGLYLFSDGRNHLYVGRSNNIPVRYATHRSIRGTLAFILASESYRRKVPKDMRYQKELFLSEPKFRDHLRDAQRRIRKMSFRAVAEGDQVRQALLEVYCAVALDTRYNDFSTH
jgi:hypothetical protein